MDNPLIAIKPPMSFLLFLVSSEMHILLVFSAIVLCLLLMLPECSAAFQNKDDESESLILTTGRNNDEYDNYSTTTGFQENLHQRIQMEGRKVYVNPDDFFASGDGISDDTQAFKDSWEMACSLRNVVLLIPLGRHYLVNATRFEGPCVGKLVIQIDGTVVAPDDPDHWKGTEAKNWLHFFKLKGVTFQGKGIIDGSGEKWWKQSCKRNRTHACLVAPTAVTISSSSHVMVKGLTIVNSQQMHLVISMCESVRVSHLLISSPGDSPNTDGIHITKSSNIVIQNSYIGTGDDCVSIVNGSSNIKMKRLYCGPGHGISIGSLGKGNSTGVVTAVVLDTALIRNTTNGLRIKTWQGGNGHVEGVRFTNVRMEDVVNPIIIDQFYCDSPTACGNQTGAVRISEIIYDNISGTTPSKTAIKFECSDSVPCTNIVLENISITNKHGETEASCHSAMGFGYGVVKPSADCLTSNTIVTENTNLPPVHDEL